MNTTVLLMVHYGPRAAIAVDLVVKDFFPHLSTDTFVRKVALGDINIPLIRIDASSKKSAKCIHVVDLVQYIDTQREAAIKESKRISEGRLIRCYKGATSSPGKSPTR
jgi:hypothetical protein